MKKYGRQLPRGCGGYGASNKCIVNSNYTVYGPLESTGIYLQNPVELCQVLDNQSTDNRVLTVSVYNKTWSYLAPTHVVSDLDFQATTIAFHSDCQIATRECGHLLTPASFNCSEGFSSTSTGKTTGESNGNIISQGFFADAQWTIPLDQTNPVNPFFTIAGLTMNSIQPPTSKSFDLTYGLLDDGGFIYFVGCETEFTNLTYTMTNGVITAAEILRITTPPLIARILEPIRYGYCNAQILDGALRSLFQTSTSNLLGTYAERYDATFLASAASVIEAIPNIVEQIRITILVTRIVKAPLFALVSMLLFTALLGLVMTLQAILNSPTSVRDVQARLSILGLTCARFESPDSAAVRVNRIEDLFREYNRPGTSNRLGMLKTEEGGWEYAIWKVAERSGTSDSQGDSIPLIATTRSQVYLSLPTVYDEVSLMNVINGVADRIAVEHTELY